MKKLYSLLALAAACAMSVSAAPRQLKKSTPFNSKVIEQTSKANDRARIEIIIPGTGDDEEEGTWTDLGTGIFVEDFLTGVSTDINPVEMKVLIQKSDDIEGVIRIVNPYAEYPYNEDGEYVATDDRYMYFNTADPTKVFQCDKNGLAWTDEFEYADFANGCDWGYGEFIISGLYNYYGSYGAYLTASGKDGSNYTIEAQKYFGTLKDGVISFPEKSFVVMMEKYEQALYGNINGRFRVVLPGYSYTDYSISLLTDGCTADNNVPVYIEKNEPSTAVSYIIWSETVVFSADNVDYLLSEYKDYFKPFEGESVTIKVDPEERNTLLAVGFDADGNLQSYAFTHLYGNRETGDWEFLGKGQLTDDMLSPWYQENPETVEVDIEMKKGAPGYLRVVNPFNNLTWVEKNYHPTDHNHYLIVNATNPDKVYIEESPVGMDLGYGNTIVSSVVEFYYKNNSTEDELAEYFGKNDNFTITFPEKALLICDYSELGQWQYANVNNAFKLVVPEYSGVEGVIADQENAPAVYYNLQGQRVTNPSTGLYIVRQGRNVTKTIIK